VSKKEQIKLEALSRMEERYVERASQTRFALWNAALRRKTVKRWVALGTVACVVLLATVVPILHFLFHKQIPVYQGMTISESHEGATALGCQPSEATSLRSMAWRRTSPVLSIGQSLETPIQFLKNEEHPHADAKDKTPTISFEEQYFAFPGEDIYITVHIDNPDSFEILSFTLNGMKYTSYMFQDGSDLEHLILKVNVGELEGVREYTIDAIKYVDGTDMKDVRMDGERTIRVEVSSKEILAISSLTVSSHDARFSVEWNEAVIRREILALSLYRNGEKERELDPTTTVVTDLLANTEYTLVLTYWRNGAEALLKQSFRTEALIVPTLALSNLKIQDERIVFDLDYSDPSDIGTLKTELLTEQDVVIAVGDGRDYAFDAKGLEGNYRIRVTCVYDARDGKGAQTIVVEEEGLALYRPILGSVVKRFSEEHPGITIQAAKDRPVYTPLAGTITRIQASNRRVNITVQYDDRISLVIYNLNSTLPASIYQGNEIRHGELVGFLEGETLYFQMLIDGVPVDPADYLYNF